jgi:hypothetical protein
MKMDMQYGLKHASWTWISSTDMDMQHGDGNAHRWEVN